MINDENNFLLRIKNRNIYYFSKTYEDDVKNIYDFFNYAKDIKHDKNIPGDFRFCVANTNYVIEHFAIDMSKRVNKQSISKKTVGSFNKSSDYKLKKELELSYDYLAHQFEVNFENHINKIDSYIEGISKTKVIFAIDIDLPNLTITIGDAHLDLFYFKRVVDKIYDAKEKGLYGVLYCDRNQIVYITIDDEFRNFYYNRGFFFGEVPRVKETINMFKLDSKRPSMIINIEE